MEAALERKTPVSDVLLRILEKRFSTLSQEAVVGMKCNVQRGWRAR
jgi:hypothetical protein